MAEPRMSLARTVVVVGLVLQFFLTLMQILVSYPLETWVSRALSGHGESMVGSLVLLLLLALVAPVARGRPWALALTVVLHFLLTLEMVPWLLRKFGQPENLLQWFLNLSYVVVGVLSVGFGIVALLESLGKRRPAGWRAGAAPSRQAVALLVVLVGYTGMLIAAAGIGRRPLPTATVSGVPDETITLAMDLMSFAPTRLVLPAGKRVALVLANNARDEHSFDIDAQNIHVRVPGRSTGIAMVEVPISGPLPFYCGVPGHTEAGMTGVIVPR